MEKAVKKASDKAHNLDKASEALRISAKKKWNRAIVLYSVAFFILLLVGVGGIIYQNYLANQSKNHLDCVIKDLSTPQKAGTTHKYIDYKSSLTKDCKIKFN